MRSPLREQGVMQGVRRPKRCLPADEVDEVALHSCDTCYSIDRGTRIGADFFFGERGFLKHADPPSLRTTTELTDSENTKSGLHRTRQLTETT